MVSLIQYICNYWCRNKKDNNNLSACKYCVHLFKEQQWASISMLWVTWKPVKLWREWELRGLSIEGGKIRGYYGLTFARTLTGKRETYWAAGTEIGEQRSPEGSFFFFGLCGDPWMHYSTLDGTYLEYFISNFEGEFYWWCSGMEMGLSCWQFHFDVYAIVASSS